MKIKKRTRRRICLNVARTLAAAGMLAAVQAVGLGELEKISVTSMWMRILAGGAAVTIFGSAALWMRERISEIESKPQNVHITMNTVVAVPKEDKPIRKVVL